MCIRDRSRPSIAGFWDLVAGAWPHDPQGAAACIGASEEPDSCDGPGGGEGAPSLEGEAPLESPSELWDSRWRSFLQRVLSPMRPPATPQQFILSALLQTQQSLTVLQQACSALEPHYKEWGESSCGQLLATDLHSVSRGTSTHRRAAAECFNTLLVHFSDGSGQSPRDCRDS